MVAEKKFDCGWPKCDEEEIQVMLLGVFHMNNSAGHYFNLEIDDILTEERQEEIRTTVDRLSKWRPEKICAEFPRSVQLSVDDEYDAYLSGEGLDELDSEEELVQLGFRLGAKLGLERIHGIDHHIFHRDYPDGYGKAFQEYWGGVKELNDFVEANIPGRSAKEDRYQNKIDCLDIPSFLKWINEEDQLSAESTKYGLLTWDNPDASKFIKQWLSRNVEIIANISRVVQETDERILLIIGVGHINELRYLLKRTPMFCPMSPIPYL